MTMLIILEKAVRVFCIIMFVCIVGGLSNLADKDDEGTHVVLYYKSRKWGLLEAPQHSHQRSVCEKPRV